jgi:hypothetical protein
MSFNPNPFFLPPPSSNLEGFENNDYIIRDGKIISHTSNSSNFNSLEPTVNNNYQYSYQNQNMYVSNAEQSSYDCENLEKGPLEKKLQGNLPTPFHPKTSSFSKTLTLHADASNFVPKSKLPNNGSSSFSQTLSLSSKEFRPKGKEQSIPEHFENLPISNQSPPCNYTPPHTTSTSMFLVSTPTLSSSFLAPPTQSDNTFSSDNSSGNTDYKIPDSCSLLPSSIPLDNSVNYAFENCQDLVDNNNEMQSGNSGEKCSAVSEHKNSHHHRHHHHDDDHHHSKHRHQKTKHGHKHSHQHPNYNTDGEDYKYPKYEEENINEKEETDEDINLPSEGNKCDQMQSRSKDDDELPPNHAGVSSSPPIQNSEYANQYNINEPTMGRVQENNVIPTFQENTSFCNVIPTFQENTNICNVIPTFQENTSFCNVIPIVMYPSPLSFPSPSFVIPSHIPLDFPSFIPSHLMPEVNLFCYNRLSFSGFQYQFNNQINYYKLAKESNRFPELDYDIMYKYGLSQTVSSKKAMPIRGQNVGKFNSNFQTQRNNMNIPPFQKFDPPTKETHLPESSISAKAFHPNKTSVDRSSSSEVTPELTVYFSFLLFF